MRPEVVEVVDVLAQHSAQRTLTENDEVIETFAANGANESLDEGVGFWRAEGVLPRGADKFDSTGVKSTVQSFRSLYS